jgi:hypothetical protein
MGGNIFGPLIKVKLEDLKKKLNLNKKKMSKHMGWAFAWEPKSSFVQFILHGDVVN